MPEEAALDTTVLRRANVPLEGTRASATLLARRLSLLQRTCRKEMCVLISTRLLHEYADQIKSAQNDFVKAFIELVTRPDGGHVVLNWKTPWSGGERDRARRCRYPLEDHHVLRTAIRDQPTTIYSEEGRMLGADACIYREFRVHITEP
jgi:hypothetical protein